MRHSAHSCTSRGLCHSHIAAAGEKRGRPRKLEDRELFFSCSLTAGRAHHFRYAIDVAKGSVAAAAAGTELPEEVKK